MSALARCGKRSVRVARKIHAESHKLVDNFGRGFNHTLDRGRVVFRMPGAHSVGKVAFVVLFALQTANTALGKIAVAFFGLALAN